MDTKYDDYDNTDSNSNYAENEYNSQNSRSYNQSEFSSDDSYNEDVASNSSYNKGGYNGQGDSEGRSYRRGYYNGGYRDQGGYNGRGYNNRGYSDQGGYGGQGYGNRNYNDQGGYNNRGYNNRGYNDQDGYNEQTGYNGRGGYNNRGYGNYRQNGYRPRGGQGGYGGYGGQGGYGSYGGAGGYRTQEYGYQGNSYGNSRGGYQKRGAKNNAMAPRAPKLSERIEEIDENELYDHCGVLEMHPNGYGFLRSAESNYDRVTRDPFVPGNVIEKLHLRQGVKIIGKVQPARGSQGPRVREIYEVDGMKPEDYADVVPFDELTPVTPKQWLKLETNKDPVSTRVIDILAPLGKGQRALIVAPPRSGKTVLLQQICQAVAVNHPNVHCIVLLIDERPEEVTDFQEKVAGYGAAANVEVVASSLDRELESHIRLAQFVIDRCKRLTEMGKDVFLLLDSITRLARSFNKWVGNTGRTMTGGVDIRAMDVPKKIFSSARATENGGSLTIVGTALIETGSRMDDLIFQEFKGTGNMELVLDRRLADRRIWPAIDITQSGTRHEEMLLSPSTLRAAATLRRVLASMDPIEAMEKLTTSLSATNSNNEFFSRFRDM